MLNLLTFPTLQSGRSNQLSYRPGYILLKYFNNTSFR